jgi:DNA polymerase-4
LCPDAVLLPPRFGAYEHISRLINRIFHEFTDLVEPLSLDEAFLDVTKNKKNEISATRIAREIKRRILLRTKLTASAGVSYNKFLAKVASGFKKPDGLTVVPPEKALKFIEKLPVGQFYGVGTVTEKKMLALGIKTGAELRKKSRVELIKLFGSAGAFFYDLARGVDERPVETDWERKSMGRETTFSVDIDSRSEMIHALGELARDVEEWMLRKNLKARTITLKIKYYDFKSITRSVSVKEPVSRAAEIMGFLIGLLDKTDAGKIKIRLIGLSLSNFTGKKPDEKKSGQMDLPL